MTAKKKNVKRDVEKQYPVLKFAAKLRRLADCLESGSRFSIRVAGKRITVPLGACISVEHERCSSEEELEFQLKWKA